MLTNTYLPHVGGVARSVASFTEAFRRRGHRVLVVAPIYDDLPEHETGVYRLPAITHFNGSDFSLRLPVPLPSAVIDEFDPDVVHAHHPFLLGDTALRVAVTRQRPLVFTHHTMYEQYTKPPPECRIAHNATS
jgi:glycosyltransferase involved in cell wall biosynthesis